MAAPVLLALDLATTTGWAVGPASGQPTYGSWALGKAGASHGERGLALVRELSALIKGHRPDVLLVEEPLRANVLLKIGATMDTLTVLYGLILVAKTVAHARQVADVREAPVQKVRKHFLGRGTFKGFRDPATKRPVTSRAVAKGAVKDRCRLLGFPVRDDNEADAVALWFYGADTLRADRAHRSTPLFGRSAAP